jgi:hypothetical protein
LVISLIFFAVLCESFALFAANEWLVRNINRKERKGFAKDRKGRVGLVE